MLILQGLTDRRAPEGRRTQGRPRMTWRRSIEREQKEMRWQSWRAATTSGKDQDE